MKKWVTIKDIAKKLNMSISTVSKALSDHHSISLPTKERVRQLAKEWNYIPNETARHFKLSKSFTIGLIIPTLMDQFYILGINGVEEIAKKNKYNVILAQSHEDVENEERIINLMISNRVDGVIVAITKNTLNMLLFQKLTSLGIPVVCIAREPRNDSFNFVSSNNKEGAVVATDFLFRKGHRRIAHIMGPLTLQASLLRLEGYKESLAKHKVNFDPELVKVVDLTEKSTITAMKQLIKLKSPPTGIFTFKNYVTLDAIDFLKKNHPDKLDKIQFTGFGNLPLLQYLDHTPVASIDERSYEMGAKAAEVLFEVIKEENAGQNLPPRNIEIPCKLVVHK
jgi:DNA-binding LacI/PurR family transcriptional regulator